MGESIFVDATEEEEYCIDSMIIVCVNRRKEVVSVKNRQGKIQGSALLGCLHVASCVAEDLFKQIDLVVDVHLCRLFYV